MFIVKYRISNGKNIYANRHSWSTDLCPSSCAAVCTVAYSPLSWLIAVRRAVSQAPAMFASPKQRTENSNNGPTLSKKKKILHRLTSVTKEVILSRTVEPQMVRPKAYNPCQPAPAQINSQRLELTSASMLAVLIAEPTATQNSPFLPQRWLRPPPVLIAPTHRGMAGLSGPEWPGITLTANGKQITVTFIPTAFNL